jgi:hypothetical protein
MQEGTQRQFNMAYKQQSLTPLFIICWIITIFLSTSNIYAQDIQYSIGAGELIPIMAFEENLSLDELLAGDGVTLRSAVRKTIESITIKQNFF